MAGDLRRAYVRHCEGKGQSYRDDTDHRFVSVQADPPDAWLELHAEVARAREEFHRTKAMRDAEKAHKNEFERGEMGYKPHELPESLKRITEGYGRSD